MAKKIPKNKNQWYRVPSSAISRIKHDKGFTYIIFTDGSRYVYRDKNAVYYTKIILGQSHGERFNRTLRKYRKGRRG